MTENDRETFGQLMAALSVTFREPVNAFRAATYWHALADLPIETVRCGVEQALKTCRFFPRPSELRDAAGAGLPDASLIESLLLKHLRRPGGERRTPTEPFLQLVVERLGGIRVAGNLSSEDRLHVLGRLVPALVHAAGVRQIPLPTEAAVDTPRRLALVVNHSEEP